MDKATAANKILITIIISSLSFNIFAVDYNFGYACKTNGNWTQAALQETRKLISVIDTLKNDENCQGLESIVSEMMAAENNFKRSVKESGRDSSSKDTNKDGIDEDNAAAQKQFLNGMAPSVPTGEKGPFFDLMAGVHMTSIVNKTLDFTSNFSGNYFKPDQVIKGLDKSATEMSDVVNHALLAFTGPKLDQCLVNSPEQGLVLISGLLRLVANTSVPGLSGGANRIGQTISNFVQYMRQAKFAKVLKGLNQTELWASITCALESSTESFCSTRDQIKLMNWGLESMEKRELVGGAHGDVKGNFLTGYYMLMRNVPVIANWLLKVQFGVEPKLITDATYKNSIWGTVLGIIKAINELKAVYNEKRRNVLNSNSVETQKNMIFNLLADIKGEMQMAVMAGEGGSSINFFTNSLQMEFLSLILVGMDKDSYPSDVLPKEKGDFSVVITPEKWLKGDGGFRPMFDDPVKLLDIIKTEMNIIIDNVQAEMRKFFIDRLIVDKMNLVAEAFTIDSTSASVYDSLELLLGYLEGLKKRILKSPYGDKQVVHLINDTINQIDTVLVAIDDYGQLTNFKQLTFNSDNTINNNETIEKDNTTLAAEKVVETVYERFNVLIQRDSFITNRLATLVHYDYFLQVLDNDGNKNMGQYERDLLIISNNEIYQKLRDAHSENPAIALEDYSNAEMINRKNIDAIESLFRNNFMEYLRETREDSDGKSIGRRNLDTVKNYYRDDFLALPKSIFGRKYKYKLNFSNPFNPDYKRKGDTENGSFTRNRNRACVQLLASPKPGIYSDLCSDAVMISPFYNAASKATRKKKLAYLNANFVDYLTEIDLSDLLPPPSLNPINRILNIKKSYKKIKELWKRTKTPKEKRRSYSGDDRICAYRDYMRRNHVHWLTLQHEQIKAHKKNKYKNSTEADNIMARARNRIRVNEMGEIKRKLNKIYASQAKLKKEEKKLKRKLERTKSKISRREKLLEINMQRDQLTTDQLKIDQKEIMSLQDEYDLLEDTIFEMGEEKNSFNQQVLDFMSKLSGIKTTYNEVESNLRIENEKLNKN